MGHLNVYHPKFLFFNGIGVTCLRMVKSRHKHTHQAVQVYCCTVFIIVHVLPKTHKPKTSLHKSQRPPNQKRWDNLTGRSRTGARNRNLGRQMEAMSDKWEATRKDSVCCHVLQLMSLVTYKYRSCPLQDYFMARSTMVQ